MLGWLVAALTGGNQGSLTRENPKSSHSIAPLDHSTRPPTAAQPLHEAVDLQCCCPNTRRRSRSGLFSPSKLRNSERSQFTKVNSAGHYYCYFEGSFALPASVATAEVERYSNEIKILN